MALGNIITAEVKTIIADVWYSHLEDGWTAKEIQAEVAKKVQEKWPGKFEPDWPGLRAVQDKLADIKEKYKGYAKYYNPWHMGTLNDYPVPAEAIPIVIGMQKWADIYKQMQFKVFEQEDALPPKDVDKMWLEWNHFDISIRQVYWIARLYTFINWDTVRKKKKAPAQVLGWLWTWSKAYMYEELRCWLSGKPPDTSKLDRALREGWGAHIMGYSYFLHPKEENAPGIMGGVVREYYRDDSLIEIIEKEEESAK